MAKYKYQYQIDGDNLGNYHKRAVATFRTHNEAKMYICMNGYMCSDYETENRGYIHNFGACIIKKKRVYI